ISRNPSSLKTLRTASARRFSASRLAKNFLRPMRMFLGGAAIDRKQTTEAWELKFYFGEKSSWSENPTN
ncbi:MAG: hypothetical protein FWC78_09410, partial [Defluviitaleaceae bacterium]|nr:hypothetical protein [Defluviitaleaceae bacterium]